jgi:ABC-type nitrate/sulfonate/bicarbonate transport system substrate-binding protein
MTDKKTTKNYLILVVAAIVIILLVAGIGYYLAQSGASGSKSATTDNGGNQTNATKTLYILKYLDNTAFSGPTGPINVAIAKGYFADEGIEMVSQGNGMAVAPDAQLSSLISGTIDVASFSTGSLILYADKNVPVTGVVSIPVTEQYNASGVAVPNGGLLVLNSSGINNASDLKGKKIAVPGRGSVSDFSMNEYFRRNNMTLDDVQLVVLPIPNMYQALSQGQVAGIYLWQDSFYQALDHPDVKILYKEQSVMGITSCGAWTFTDDFIQKHPDVVRGFVTAYVKAWDYNNAHPQEYQQIAVAWYDKQSLNSSVTRYITTSGTRPHALIQDNDIITFENSLVSLGQLKSATVAPSDVYTNKFNPYA